MKISFYLADQNPQRDRSLGITGYTDGLIRALGKQSSLELSALASRSSYRPPPGVATYLLPFSTTGGAARFLADNFHGLSGNRKTDIWHYPKGHLPLAGRYRKPVIGTVHDTILQHYADKYPEDRTRLNYTYWRTVLKRSIGRFDRILTISKTSERAIRAFCDRYHLRCPPLRVTYEGFGLVTESLEGVQKQEAVVHLASRELHKRTSTLLKFWETLSQVEGSLPLLKLIGSLRPDDQRFAATLRGVDACGRLSRGDLEAEIARARALILPSEVEGFGLPALEAYALRTPVVYVSGTAVEEILGEGTPGGFLLDEFETFRAALRAVLDMSSRSIAERSTHLASRFSWEACAAATLDAYREVR